jgi:predicted RNA-binding Zn-ribbon protein involved in translation (DUF1610 family)
MADLLTLTCPTCGGSLQVTNDVDHFACMHCGNTHIVDPETRAASLAGEVQTLRAEVTAQRLQSELAILKKRRDEAHLGLTQMQLKTREYNRVRWLLRYLFAGCTLLCVIATLSIWNDKGLSSQLLPASGLSLGACLIAFLLPHKKGGSDYQAAKEKLVAVNNQIARAEEELKQVQSSHLMSDTHHATGSV